MKPPRAPFLLLSPLALALVLSAGGDSSATPGPHVDWPRWRGPFADGAAPGAEPPVTWSEEEHVRWKTALPGHGKSTPIVYGDRIFLQAAVPAREATVEELAERPAPEGASTELPKRLISFRVLAVDRGTGKVLWERQVAERLPLSGTHETNGYASFSPVTDGSGLYVSFGSYGVYALDPATGEVRWSHDLGPQRTRRGYGEGGSPALAGDRLVVVADQEDQSFVEALDTRTGEPVWHVERDEPTTWTTPLVVAGGGTTQVVVNGTTAARSYDLATGALLWHCGGQTANPIPSPVTDGEVVVVTSGFRGSACFAFSLAGRGDLGSSGGGIRWKHSDGTPYVPSPLLADGRVYLLGGNSGRLSCLDLSTGEVLLDRFHLSLDSVYASPVYAAGRVYVVGRDGTTVVVEHADGDAQIVATNVLDDPIDASPAIVGDTIYLRSDAHLYAIGE